MSITAPERGRRCRSHRPSSSDRSSHIPVRSRWAVNYHQKVIGTPIPAHQHPLSRMPHKFLIFGPARQVCYRRSWRRSGAPWASIYQHQPRACLQAHRITTDAVPRKVEPYTGDKRTSAQRSWKVTVVGGVLIAASRSDEIINSR